MKSNSTKSTFLLLTLIVQTGCLSGYLPGHAYRKGGYDWGFINRSEQMLQDVELLYTTAGEDGGAGGGWLAPHASKSDGRGVHPVPEKGILHWRAPDGVAHEQEVVIRPLLPRPKYAPDPTYFTKGTVWFVYDGKQWTVKPLTWDEEQRRVVEEKKSWPLEVVY